MKFRLFLFLLLLPILSMAQNMEILGVPITGTISEFTTKFNKKGIKTDWTTSKHSGEETRWFTGTYYGRNCQFIAYYIPTSKLVYRVKVIINFGWGSHSSCENLAEEIKNALSNKYGIEFHRGNHDGYPAWSGPFDEPVFFYGEDNELIEGAITIGWVDVYMSLNDGYVIHIDFYDSQNYYKYQEYLDSTY